MFELRSYGINSNPADGKADRGNVRNQRVKTINRTMSH